MCPKKIDLSDVETGELEAELARRKVETRPEKDPKPNWMPLSNLIDTYIEFCANLEEFHEDNDYEYYIAERAIKALYPGFYEWYNNRYK